MASRDPELDDLFKAKATFTPSRDLMISCGCVVVDPSARKIAVISNGELSGAIELPKGRKNIGEHLHDAALREASEETGVPVKPLPLKLATRATVPRSDPVPQDVFSITEDRSICEIVSVHTYRCKHTGANKMVFWYAGEADSTVAPDRSNLDPWEEHLDMRWVDADKAAGMMNFDEDGLTVMKVLDDMRKSGYDI